MMAIFMLVALFVTANAALAANPTAEDNTININENIIYTLVEADFNFADGDGNALATVNIKTLPVDGNLTLNDIAVNVDQAIAVADINNNLFKFTPTADENGAPYTNFTFTVTDDNAEESNSANTITINVNDIPVIDAIENQSAYETKEFSLTVTATDADNQSEELSINAANSVLPAWLNIDPENDMRLVGTPALVNVGDQSDVSIVVSDGLVNSQAEAFTISVESALQILDNTIQVTVDAQNQNASNPIDVTPGSQVSVSFNYENKLELILGNVDITGNSDDNQANNDPNPTFDNDFVNYSDNDWSVPALATPTDTFSFTVPNTVADSFTVTIGLQDEDSQNNQHSDNHILSFNVNKNNKDLTIESAIVNDNSLTCSKIPNLQLSITNTGDNNIIPEMWIFNAPATLADDGTMTSATATFNLEHRNGVQGVNIVAIAESATDIFNIPLNLSEVSGAQTLYVYVNNPFILDNNNNPIIADETTVQVTSTGNCLKESAIETDLTFSKNANVPITIDLMEEVVLENIEDNPDTPYFENKEYKYIEEEVGLYNDLVFTVDEESNVALVDCSIAGGTSLLSCTVQPGVNEDGNSQVTIGVAQGTSSTQENVDVTINPTIRFTSIQINGNSQVNVDENGITVKPLDTLTIAYTAHNYLDENVFQITTNVQDPDNLGDGYQFVFAEDDQFNLIANGEQSGTIEVTIPGDVTTGEYNLVLAALGNAVGVVAPSDSYAFTLKVQQDPSSMIIEASLADEEMAQLTCDADIVINTATTNTGQVAEDDITITVTEGQEELFKVSELNIGPNGATLNFPIEVPVSGAGTHNLNVNLQYNFAGEVAGSSAQSVVIPVTKTNCISKVEPTSTSLTIAEDASQSFTVDVEDGHENDVEWFVVGGDEADDNNILANGEQFTFVANNQLGQNTIKAVLHSDPEDKVEWTVTVSDKPTDLNLFGFTQQEIDAIENINSVDNLILENTHGKVEFSQTVDLSDITVVTEVVKLENQLIGIDSANAATLNQPATITLNNIDSGKTVIMKYPGFGDELGEAVQCEEDCTTISHTNGKFKFSVDSFSTYQVLIEKEVDLETPSEISLTDTDFGTSGNVSFEIKNAGTLNAMSNIAFDLSDINAKYEASLQDAPISLAALETAQVNLDLKVQDDEEAGKNKIGDLVISWQNQIGEQSSTSVPVYITPKSYLIVESIKINGKTSGDLSLDEENEIKVEVKNDYTEDMEDVLVTVKILDVDGDDLEEESEEYDIDNGDDENDFEVEFDLSSEDIDEEKYTIEVTVEGEAEDGSEHETVVTKEVSLDLEKHNVIIKKASLTSETVQCLKQTNLEVTVENIGKSNENEVEIKVTNSELGIDEVQRNIDLDKFSGKDKDYRAVFSLNLNEANAGSYPISIEVFRDEDKLEQSKSVTLTVEDCLTTSTTSQVQNELANAQLAQQLQQQLEARQQQTESAKVQASFRESTGYFVLLAILAILLFIALILMVAVLVVKKPTKTVKQN